MVLRNILMQKMRNKQYLQMEQFNELIKKKLNQLFIAVDKSYFFFKLIHFLQDTIYPDGLKVRKNPNGSIKRYYPDG